MGTVCIPSCPMTKERNLKMKITKIAILSLTATMLVACGQKKEEAPKNAPQPVKTVRMDVPSGTKAPATEPVDTLPGQTHVKITCQCLATVDPEQLYLMPRDIKSARRDTALLRRINDGLVYVVQPGETGYILAKDGDKLQLRFPDKIAWVMVSNTK